MQHHFPFSGQSYQNNFPSTANPNNSSFLSAVNPNTSSFLSAANGTRYVSFQRQVSSFLHSVNPNKFPCILSHYELNIKEWAWSSKPSKVQNNHNSSTLHYLLSGITSVISILFRECAFGVGVPLCLRVVTSLPLTYTCTRSPPTQSSESLIAP